MSGKKIRGKAKPHVPQGAGGLRDGLAHGIGKRVAEDEAAG